MTGARRRAPEPSPVAASDGPHSAITGDTAALARLLRALASEVERSPMLARRVLAAMARPAPDGSPADIPAPGSAPADDAAHADASLEAASAPTRGSALRATRATRRGFQPRIVAGTPDELGPGVPDPYALRARLGGPGLRAALAELRLGTLRAMVREHGLDPTGQIRAQNDAERLRALILAATRRT